MVGFQYPQLNNDNGFVKCMPTKIKNTEQGLHKLCGSFFFFMIEKYFLPEYTIYKGKQHSIHQYNGKVHEIPAKFFFHEIWRKFFLDVSEKNKDTIVFRKNFRIWRESQKVNSHKFVNKNI